MTETAQPVEKQKLTSQHGKHCPTPHKRRLPCTAKKPSLPSEQALFALQARLVCLWAEMGMRSPMHCHHNLSLLSGKNFHPRVPRSGTSMRNPLQAVKRRSCGWARMQGAVPEGGLMPLALSRMYKSRFAEHYPFKQLHPQLRRKAACSGFRIEVYLRHTPCAFNK